MSAQKTAGINLYREVRNWLVCFQEVAKEACQTGQFIHTLFTPALFPEINDSQRTFLLANGKRA